MTFLRRWRRWSAAVALAIALLAFGVARLFGIVPLHVVTGSMEPTVKIGDWAVRQDVGVTELRPGDIGVFHYPAGAEQLAVKRVVAVAGDRVVVTRDAVTVNGKRHTTRIGTLPFQPNNHPGKLDVPNNSVFLLGDNRTNSIDSRALGPIPAKEMAGRVLFVFPWWALPLILGVLLQLLVLMAIPVRKHHHTSEIPKGAPLMADNALHLDHPEVLATYENYADAQRAVDHLSDHGFPVGVCRIVGSDLKQIEVVTGRLTWARVAFAGLAAGGWVGLMVGLVLAIFAQADAGLPVVAGTVGLGAVMGLAASLVGYASTRGQRDFTSRTQIVATGYEVLVDAGHHAQASGLIADMTPQVH